MPMTFAEGMAKRKARYEAHREKVKNDPAWKAKHAAWVKDWRHRKAPTLTEEQKEAERQKNRERNAKYREKHREKVRESARTRARKYYAADPTKYIGREHSKRAVKARGKVTAADWQAIKAAYDGCCAYCNRPFARLEMDHVVALTKGGRHVPSNVRPACRQCNAAKGNREVVPRPPHHPELFPKDHEE